MNELEVLMVTSALAVDAVRGFVFRKTIDPALEPIWRALMSVFAPRSDEAHGAIQLNLQEAVDRRDAQDRDYVDRLERSLKRGEANALVTHLWRAAAQATTEERMHMLAAAAAGVLIPDFDSDMRSRVVRAVDQLEPSDVILLRDAVARTPAPPTDPRVHHAYDGPEAASGLFQAGCLALAGGGLSFGHVFIVTPLGHSVLRALVSWQPTP